MKYKSLFIVLGVFLIVLFNSFIYGTLNTEMFIDGDVYVRVDRDIRVTGIKVIEQVSGAYEIYNCDYSKDSTSLQVTLPSSDSFIVYEVTIMNKGDVDYEVTNIIEESYSNNNVKYELIALEKGTVIDGKTTHTFRIKLTTTENDSENKGTLVLKYTFEEWVPSLYEMVAHKSRSLDTNIDFNVAPTKETSGVYEMNSTKDDEYPVYYYRGIIDNNNVSFAEFCWKAVRTTSTGGVKLVYNGVPASDGSCNNMGAASLIGTSAFNTSKSTKDDGSYIYDNGTDSAIKKVIDKWYFDNMTEYTNMLEDTVWCNDRSIYRTVAGDAIYYGQFYGNERVTTMVCPREEDSFTVDEGNGNGKLTYPIALLTSPEVRLTSTSRGIGYNSSDYLAIGRDWWLMSPNHFNLSNNSLVQEWVGNNYSNYNSSSIVGVRPSISIASGTMIKEGNGSVTNPYKLVENKIQKEQTFDYTGDIQEFKVSVPGVYKLEIWGSQGGTNTGTNGKSVGGYGGYATGNVLLNRDDMLYIGVGSISGYNGGGYGLRGGGATHIALNNNLKELYNYKNNISDLLIVAGGGGGSDAPVGWETSSSVIVSGSGGGFQGNASSFSPGYGGTQTAGGAGYRSGSFGRGGDSNLTGDTGGGGGGGFYGGGSGSSPTWSDGGGGSGYIGSSSLTNKVMYCYKCKESSEESTKTISTTNVSEEPISNYAKKRNGYAKITFLG